MPHTLFSQYILASGLAVALGYLWMRFQGGISRRWRWPGALLYVLMFAVAMAPRFVSFGLNPLEKYLSLISGFWIVVLSNWLVTCVAVDVFVAVVWINKRMLGLGGSAREISHFLSRKRNAAMPLLAILVLLTSVAFWVYGYDHQLAFQRTEKTIHVAKPLAKPLRIAVFSDIHFGPLFEVSKFDRLLDTLNKIQPDMIFFLGDMTDLTSNELDAVGLGDRINRMHAPLGVYGITGNHEGYTLGHDRHILDWMELHGIQLLRDESICLPQVCMTGRDDPAVSNEIGPPRKVFASIVPNLDEAAHKPWLVFDHQPFGLTPDDVNGLAQRPDLGISGHTHGGQFFPWNFVIRLFWPLAQGFGVLDGVPWYVTSGFGQGGPAVRVGTNAEVLIIDLVGK